MRDDHAAPEQTVQKAPPTRRGLLGRTAGWTFLSVGGFIGLPVYAAHHSIVVLVLWTVCAVDAGRRAIRSAFRFHGAG